MNAPLTFFPRAIIILYNRILLLLVGLAPPQSTITLFAVVGCAIVIVVLNIMSITMYATLPFNVYMMGPTFSIGLVLILNAILKSVSYYEILSKEMLHRWKNDARLVAWGILKEHGRRVVAMRPILVYIGVWRTNLLQINIELLCRWNAAIVDATITVLLTNT